MLSSSRRTASFGWKRALRSLETPAFTRPRRIISTSAAVGCGELGVAEPGLDRQEIHARPEELHGERMPEDVR